MTIPAVIFIWNTTSSDDYSGGEEEFTHCYFQGTFDENGTNSVAAVDVDVDEHDTAFDNEKRFICQSIPRRRMDNVLSRRKDWGRRDSSSTLRLPQLPQRSMDSVSESDSEAADVDMDNSRNNHGVLSRLGITVNTSTPRKKSTPSSQAPRRIRRIESDMTEDSRTIAKNLPKTLSPQKPERCTSSVQRPAMSAPSA